MPDPKRYTVRDPESGRTVTFAWSGDAPPTDDEIGEVFASVPAEPPLTRERPATPATPSERTLFGKRIPTIRDVGPGDLPSDAAFLRRAPEIGGTAGMMVAGPIGAGAGAAAGSLVKGQFERGAHMPTGGELGGAALEGGKALVLGGAPRAMASAARAVGPAVASHAKGISQATSALTGLGSGIASGNPITGLGVGAATRMLTSPGAIRTAGNVATRVGNAPMHAVNKAGAGAIAAEAYRQALLDALEAEPSASTVP